MFKRFIVVVLVSSLVSVSALAFTTREEARDRLWRAVVIKNGGVFKEEIQVAIQAAGGLHAYANREAASACKDYLESYGKSEKLDEVIAEVLEKVEASLHTNPYYYNRPDTLQDHKYYFEVFLREAASQARSTLALQDKYRVPAGTREETPVWVIPSSANIRSSPSTQSKVIAGAKRNDKLLVIEELQQWYKVRLPGGQIGWLYSPLCSSTPLD